jgi:chaperonin GroES
VSNRLSATSANPRSPHTAAFRAARRPPDERTRAYPCGVVERQQEQHLNVTLEPLDDWIVVEPVDAEAWTRGGLIIPVGADQSCTSGIVTAAGVDAGGIELGDKVLFPKDAGYDVRVGSGTVKLLRREHVIARVHD